MLTAFGITDDILISGFYELGRDHDATLDKVLRVGRQTTLKLKIRLLSFHITNAPESHSSVK